MKPKRRFLTKQQISLLMSDIPIGALLKMQIFKGYSQERLSSARSRRKVAEYEKEKPAKVVKAKPYELYQFIKVSEATPERVKQW